MSNWNWTKQVCRTVEITLGWGVSGRAIAAIEAVEVGVPRTGHRDGYNWETWVSPETGEIQGSCGYGSFCRIDQDNILLQTCGGHWVIARRGILEDKIIWSTDQAESCRSWGELSQANIEENHPDAYLEGQELEIKRIERLKSNEGLR